MPKSGTVVRDVTPPGFTGVLKAGLVVYEYEGYTYGCISPSGVAVTAEPGKEPFFEVPANAVAWEKPHKGRIENWVESFGMVFGEIYGHPDKSFHDGGPIRTSRIVKIDRRPGGEVETLNSRYTLGKQA